MFDKKIWIVCHWTGKVKWVSKPMTYDEAHDYAENLILNGEDKVVIKELW